MWILFISPVDSIRAEIPGVERFVALEGEAAGWEQYEDLVAAAPADFEKPDPHLPTNDHSTDNQQPNPPDRNKPVELPSTNSAL